MKVVVGIWLFVSFCYTRSRSKSQPETIEKSVYYSHSDEATQNSYFQRSLGRGYLNALMQMENGGNINVLKHTLEFKVPKEYLFQSKCSPQDWNKPENYVIDEALLVNLPSCNLPFKSIESLSKTTDFRFVNVVYGDEKKMLAKFFKSDEAFKREILYSQLYHPLQMTPYCVDYNEKYVVYPSGTSLKNLDEIGSREMKELLFNLLVMIFIFHSKNLLINWIPLDSIVNVEGKWYFTGYSSIRSIADQTFKSRSNLYFASLEVQSLLLQPVNQGSDWWIFGMISWYLISLHKKAPCTIPFFITSSAIELNSFDHFDEIERGFLSHFFVEDSNERIWSFSKYRCIKNHEFFKEIKFI